MQNYIIEIMNQFGYWGVGLLMALENVLLFIPSEIILIFGGFMTTYSNLNMWVVILFATIGSVIGALLLYGVGRIINLDYLETFFSGKTGQVLHLQRSDINKASSWFAEKGNVAIIICRFVPMVRCLISIPAGAAKMNLVTFLLLTTLGAAIWNTVLVCLGVFAGESWENMVHHMHTYAAVALVITVLIVFIFLNVLFKRRLKRKKDNKTLPKE